jgi:hypothetical protein
MDAIELFYQELLNTFGSDELDADWKSLCPGLDFREWKEYCFSFESPY